jgi:hypothetical protein
MNKALKRESPNGRSGRRGNRTRNDTILKLAHKAGVVEERETSGGGESGRRSKWTARRIGGPNCPAPPA